MPGWDDERYHEYARLFPSLTDADYQLLLEDIRAHGQTTPILMYQGKVIDGRCRDRACRELGIEPKMVEWDGAGCLLDRVVSLNLHRRHLTASQRALAAARLEPYYAEVARKRMVAGKAPDPLANLPQGPSREQAAKELKVSGRNVGAAKKVLAAGSTKLIQAVAAGDVKVSAAEQLAKLPIPAQDEVLDQGGAAVRQQARQQRQQKQSSRKRPAKRLPLTLTPRSAAPSVASSLLRYFGPSVAIAIRNALSALLETSSLPAAPSADSANKSQVGQSETKVSELAEPEGNSGATT